MCRTMNDDPTHKDLGEYNWKMNYDECKKIYAKAVIFINKSLIRLIDVTMEQWLDHKYGDHKTWNKNVKKAVIGTWLIRSYKLQFEEYLEIKRKRETYAREFDMEYNPSNLVFDEWLASKFYNHLEMDWYIKNALWVYWMRGDDEVILSDDEVLDLKNKNNNDEHELAKIFRIETNLFNYETPLCMKFKEINYLLKVDAELFTHDIERTKTYEDYESELNNEDNEPWSKDGAPYEICDHICEPLRFKNGKTKWLTCNSNDNGFCNGGELSGMVRVGYMTYFQDYEWYEELMDSSLKEEALKNFHELDYELLVKIQDYWWKVNDHECSPFTNLRDHIRRPYANYYSNVQDEVKQEDNERCELIDDRESPICKIKRFEMIKYSFGQEEEYVAIKEHEYYDLTRTNDDACHAYEEIFRNMDEGWLVTRAD
ncbi:hypothetical protein Tco_1420701 [Tanacetum coccineum]